ncbi:uncharacterized protein LOC142173469 [Nicotiana tabacum]|uniref:Uncharacterized protein LOC142173469 n=1 Tax=Nicotiana tabacum TaxID=4097 RepID=A0AC58TD59_TOBAC
MRASLKAAFNVNISEVKCKRAKRLILESLEGSFTDEYNKLVAYVIELKFSNPGTDVIVNLSKDALAEGKRRFLRMYISFYAMKMRFKNWLTPFIGLNGTFLKGKVKGQLLVAVGQDSSVSQVDDDVKAVIEDLLKYPPTCWSRAFFDTTYKNQSVDNNLTESFNAWILQARHKPIIKMLEEIRIKVMNMLTDNEAEVCHVNGNANQGYKVTEGNDRHIVNLGAKKYTCRTWDLCGLSCPHAICALLYKKVDPLSEIHRYLSKEAYLQTYSHKLQPVRGEKFWKIDPSQNMEPPEFVRMAGRPKVKRIIKTNESFNRQGQWSQSRKGRVMTCNNCGEPGHNARGCAKHSKGK